MPYIFQILAALLETNGTGALPPKYAALLGPLLTPTLWETRGNVPGCARLLSAVIPKAATLIQTEGKLEQVLGIFQGLMPSKKTELYGFDVMEAVVVAFNG